MSLLDDFARPCVLLEKSRTPDGAVLVQKAVPIDYNDFFRDKTTGETYRVTSEPKDKQTPKSASFALKYFTAEKKALPT